MAQKNAAQEQPSMEDILTSIRRIIDDGNNKPSATANARKQVANDRPQAKPAAPRLSTLTPMPQASVSKSPEAQTAETALPSTPNPSVAPAVELPKPVQAPAAAAAAPTAASPSPQPTSQERANELAKAAAAQLAEQNKREVDEAELSSFLESLDAKYENLVEEAASASPSAEAEISGANEPIEGEYSPQMVNAMSASKGAANLGQADKQRSHALSEADQTTFEEVANALSKSVKRAEQVISKTEAAKPEPSASISLISEDSRNAIGGSFESLSAALAKEAGRDLPGMTEDLLKPMLSDWLDNNLPSMVERLVRAEIERIARGD